MSKIIKISESQLINIIDRVIKEDETKSTEKPVEKKVETTRTLSKNKDFIKKAQFNTRYPAKLDPKNKGILLVKKGNQTDENLMELDLGYKIRGCSVDFIEHDGNEVTLYCSPSF